MSETPEAESTPTDAPSSEESSKAGAWKRAAADQRADMRQALRWFAVAFAVLFVINLAQGLLAGTLSPGGTGRGAVALSLMSVVFAPFLGAGVFVLCAMCLRDIRRGRAAQGVVGLSLVILPAAYLGSGAFARSMMFPGASRALPAAGTEVAPGVTVVEYATEDGIVLRGVLARGTGPAPRPGVAFFHGNGESVAWNVDLAVRMAADNMDVFMGEFRGYGGCEGSPTREGLLRDGRAALRAFEEAVGAPASLLVGRSLGTGLVAELAAEGHGQGVVLVSPYTSIQSMAERMFPRALALFALRDNFDSRAALARCTQRVSIFHGTQDRVIPYAEGQALAESLGERAKLFTAEGAGHNDIYNAVGAQIFAETARLAREVSSR